MVPHSRAIHNNAIMYATAKLWPNLRYGALRLHSGRISQALAVWSDKVLGFRRYGGDIENKYSGLERFVEVRGIAIAVGVPTAMFAGIAHLPVGVVTGLAVIAYFVFGFIGEWRTKYGLAAVLFVAIISLAASVYLDRAPFFASALTLPAHLFVVWNGYVLYRRKFR